MYVCEIRNAEPGDLEAILGLLNELGGFTHERHELTRDDVKRVFAAMDAAKGTYKSLVAVVDNQVVGLVTTVYYQSLFHRGGTALINELVVSEKHRSGGIGRALVQRAADSARSDGMDEIEVGTERTNEGAIAFYKRVGFNEEYVLLGREFG